MDNRDIVVVGTSAGGLRALSWLLGGLHEDFAAAMFIVMHTSRHYPSLLPEILTNRTNLRCRHAVDREPIHHAKIYIAPPDRHMVLEGDQVRLTKGPKENHSRPAIDTLFRSAAYYYGPRVIGVILTGTLDDGAAGLWAIKSRGGVAMVQDPKEADYPSMPLNAIQNVDVDECLPLARIPEALTRLIAEPPGSAQESAMSKQLEIETKIALENDPLTAGVMSLGEPSTFTCPSCHGSLLELKTGKMVRYRCHTGHAFSIQSLLAELTESTEDVLWNTIRALDEKIMLLSHLMQHAREHNQTDTETVLTTLANDAERQISLLREAMQSSPGTIRPTLTDNAFSSK